MTRWKRDMNTDPTDKSAVPPVTQSSRTLAYASPRLGVSGHAGRVARQLVMELILLALCVYLSIRADGFLTLRNLLDILRNVSIEGLIAFGMTMVIIAGEIDLSVGSAVAFSGCLTAWLTAWLIGKPLHLSMGIALVLALCASMTVGFAIGCINGFLRVHFRVPTFISTLAWLTIFRGAAGELTHGFPLTPFPDWYNFLGGGYLLGIPFPAIVFVAAFVVIQSIMTFTSFGRSVYAVGGNPEAARLSGINVSMVKIMVMGLVGFLAATSGVMRASQIMSGNPTTSVGLELDVISAVIIGGTSLLGGAGTVWGTLIGMIFLGVIVNGMTLLDVSPYRQEMVRGGLILAAAIINAVPKERK
jgi:ribose/xylose/arabinose/galactoside ABC-type transport system permease subunit